METWLPFAENCEVSNLGNIVHIYGGRRCVIKKRRDRDGYLFVQISIKGQRITFKVHRLVARAFVLNPDNKPEVNHLNGIKTDNRADNLAWATRSENEKHAYDIGLAKSCEEHSNAKLTNEIVKWIREVYKPYDKQFGQNSLARQLGVDKATIRNVVLRKTYNRVS